MKVLIVCSGKPSNPKWSFELTRSYVYEQIESIKNLNVGVEYDTYFVEGSGISGYLKNYKAMLEKIESYKPDLIHAHYGLSGLLATLQRKVPVITTFHGSDINVPAIRPFSVVASKLSTDNIFVHKDQPSKIFYNKEIHLIPCGVDVNIFKVTDKFIAREKLSLDPEKKYILFTGTFTNKVKNYPLAKETIYLLKGDVELIELRGYSREEVALLMSAVDVLIMTSFTEGSPLVIREAMSCNCPIVSVDVGDVKEVITNTEGCYVSSEYSAKELAIYIDKILEENKRTEGREKMLKEYALEKIAKEVFEVYKKVGR